MLDWQTKPGLTLSRRLQSPPRVKIVLSFWLFFGLGKPDFCGRNSVVECLLPKQKVNSTPGNPLFSRPCSPRL